MQTITSMALPQDTETALHQQRAGGFAWRFAYGRSAECRSAGDTGQDYLAFAHGDGTFRFALCDGVSQSFYGNLAARFLGDALLDWLDRLPSPWPDAEALGADLEARLRTLTDPATQFVAAQPLPNDLPPLLAQVLEQKRALGSDTTFVCGRIELTDDPEQAGELVLAWMGDSRLRLWFPDPAAEAALAGAFQTAQRWSSARGPIGGTPHVYVGSLSRRASLGLAAYSDGLAALDGRQRPPGNFAIEAAIADAAASPTSDDVSFLEVWLGAAPAELDAEPLAAPAALRLATGDGEALAWSALDGATGYDIELSGERSWLFHTETPAWPLAGAPTGARSARVRGRSEDDPGRWSEPIALPAATAEPPPALEPHATQVPAISVGATAAGDTTPRRRRRRTLPAALLAAAVIAAVGIISWRASRDSTTIVPQATGAIASPAGINVATEEPASATPSLKSPSPPAGSATAVGAGAPASGTATAVATAASATPAAEGASATATAIGSPGVVASATPAPAAAAEPAATPRPTRYTVQPGDTLWAIAANAYGDPSRWLSLFRANQALFANPNTIYPGQVIELP